MGAFATPASVALSARTRESSAGSGTPGGTERRGAAAPERGLFVDKPPMPYRIHRVLKRWARHVASPATAVRPEGRLQQLFQGTRAYGRPWAEHDLTARVQTGVRSREIDVYKGVFS